MWRFWLRFRRPRKRQIDPDEVFLDARNLPSFNTQQFEGWIERPVGKAPFRLLGGILLLVLLIFTYKLVDLQIVSGSVYSRYSANNTLRHIPIFYERGIITDRYGVELAWNEPDRRYTDKPGFAHLLGYIALPVKSELIEGDVLTQEYIGRDGAERVFNDWLKGKTGLKIEEVDVFGQARSEHVLEHPETGKDLVLSVDARVQEALYRSLEDVLGRVNFQAGAGVLMDINSGEIIAMTSLPEYDPNILTSGSDRGRIAEFVADARRPFFNRVIQGRYIPGSTVKPFIALGALNEGVISPSKQILSTASISIPNPYAPGQATVFRDWRAHGLVDVRRALAVSSNIYFYAVGGGYGDQRGIGISGINKYLRLFGFGETTGLRFVREEVGNIPSPEWKAKTFNNEPWRLGDSFHSSIGQYGFEITPLQMVRGVAAIANSGVLVTPTLQKIEPGDTIPLRIISDIKPEYYQIVREGMRMAVTEGYSRSLDLPNVKVAVKTGTAELGITKQHVNSWITGFFPYESPRYAFVIVLERGPRETQVGASLVIRQLLDWLTTYAPEYLAKVDLVSEGR